MPGESHAPEEHSAYQRGRLCDRLKGICAELQAVREDAAEESVVTRKLDHAANDIEEAARMIRNGGYVGQTATGDLFDAQPAMFADSPAQRR